MKLSEKQFALLDKLSNGQIVRVSELGQRAHAWLPETTPIESAPMTTVNSLLDRDYLDRTESLEWRWSEWRISDRGRAALAAAKAKRAAQAAG